MMALRMISFFSVKCLYEFSVKLFYLSSFFQNKNLIFFFLYVIESSDLCIVFFFSLSL